ncbi:hypothetical protein ACQPW3_20485 [Actinosynnema sp. CA-248983]
MHRHTPPLGHVHARPQLVHQRVRHVVLFSEQPPHPGRLHRVPGTDSVVGEVRTPLGEVGQQRHDLGQQRVVPGLAVFVQAFGDRLGGPGRGLAPGGACGVGGHPVHHGRRGDDGQLVAQDEHRHHGEAAGVLADPRRVGEAAHDVQREERAGGAGTEVEQQEHAEPADHAEGPLLLRHHEPVVHPRQRQTRRHDDQRQQRPPRRPGRTRPRPYRQNRQQQSESRDLAG